MMMTAEETKVIR